MTAKLESRTPADLGSDDEVVEAFLSASRALVGVAVRSLAGSGSDVTLPQYRALVVLASRGTQRIRDLADHLGVDSSNATRICDRLQRRDLVTRDQDAGDRRSVRVSVTSAGAQLVRDTTRSRKAQIALILAAMPTDGRAPLLAALRAFADAAGEVPEQNWSLGWGDI